MKKLLMLLISLFPTFVFAEGITYDCQENKNEKNCTMYAESNFNMSAIEYHIKGKVSNFVATNNWLGDYENGSILLYTDDLRSGKVEIGTITIKGKIKEEYLSYGDDSFKEVVIYDKRNNNKYYIVMIIIVVLILSILIVLKRRNKK